MRVALDTNILAYAEGLGDVTRCAAARLLVEQLPGDVVVLPAQAAALDLNVDHQVPMWDALILAVAAEARCRLLLSEDIQNSFTWRGVTVVNPFSAPVSPLLAGLLVQSKH